MAEGLTFDEVKHQYFFDGKPVPGVNEILKTVGLSRDYTNLDPFYRDRGIAVHKAIELAVSGTLDENTIDPIIRPYFDGALKFLDTLPDPPQAVEERQYSKRLNFAGTLDMVAGDTIIDFKCSKSPDPVSELQGCAYQTLWGEKVGIIVPFIVIQLPGDGTFKVINYKTKSLNLWDSVMEIYNWKVKR